MDNIFEIKEEYKAVVVGFNGSGLPLGKRDDLHLLAEMAHISGSPSLKKLFVDLPSTEEISAYKGEKFVALQGEKKSEPIRNKPSTKKAIKKELKADSEPTPESEATGTNESNTETVEEKTETAQ